METMNMQAIVKFVHELSDQGDSVAAGAVSSGTSDPITWVFFALIAIALLGAGYFLVSRFFGVKKSLVGKIQARRGGVFFGTHVAQHARWENQASVNRIFGDHKNLIVAIIGAIAIVLFAVAGVVEAFNQATIASAANNVEPQKAVFTITKNDEGQTVIEGNDQDIIAHVYDDGNIVYDNFTLKNETGDFIEVSKTKLQNMTADSSINWKFVIAESEKNAIYDGPAYTKDDEQAQRSWSRIEKDQTVDVEVTSSIDYATAQTLIGKQAVKLGLDAMISPVTIDNVIQPDKLLTILDLKKDPYTNNVIKTLKGEDFNFYIEKNEKKDCEIFWVDKNDNYKAIEKGEKNEYILKKEDIEKGGYLFLYEAYTVALSLGGGSLESSSIPEGWNYSTSGDFYYKTFEAGTKVADVGAEWRHDKANVTKKVGQTAYARFSPDKWTSTFPTEYVDMIGGELTLEWQEGVTLTRNTDYKDYLQITDSSDVVYTDKEWGDAQTIVVPKGEFKFKVKLIGDEAKKTNAKIEVKHQDDKDYTYDKTTGLYSANFTANDQVNTYELFKATINMVENGADLKTTTTIPTNWNKNSSQTPITYEKYFYRYVTTHQTTASTIKSDWGYTSSESYDASVTQEAIRKYVYANHWFTGLGGEDTTKLEDDLTINATWGDKKAASSIKVKDKDGTEITKDKPLEMNIDVHETPDSLPTATASYVTEGNPNIEFPAQGEGSPQFTGLPQPTSGVYIPFSSTVTITGNKGDTTMSHEVKVDPTPNFGTEDETIYPDGMYTFTLNYPETDNFKEQTATYYVKIKMLHDDFKLDYENEKPKISPDAIEMAYDSSIADNLTWNTKTSDQIVADYSKMVRPEIDAEIKTTKGTDLKDFVVVRYKVESHAENNVTKIDENLVNIAPKDGAKEKLLQLIQGQETDFYVKFNLPKSAYYAATSTHTINVKLTKADSDTIIEDGENYYADETVESTNATSTVYKNIYIYAGSTANVKIKSNAGAEMKKTGDTYNATLKNDAEGTKEPQYSTMDPKTITIDSETQNYIIPVKAKSEKSNANYDWLTVPFEETQTTAQVVAASKTFKIRVYIIEKKATISELGDVDVALGEEKTKDFKYLGETYKEGTTKKPTVTIYDGNNNNVTTSYFDKCSLAFKSGTESNQVWTLTTKPKIYLDEAKTQVVPVGDYKVAIHFEKSENWDAVDSETNLTVTKQTPKLKDYDPEVGINVTRNVWETKVDTLSITNAPSDYALSIEDSSIVTSKYDSTNNTLTTEGLKATTTPEQTPATTKGVLSFPETPTTNATNFNINYTVNKVKETARWAIAQTITVANTEYRIPCSVPYKGDAAASDLGLYKKNAEEYSKIEDATVLYDASYNELVVICPTAKQNGTAYIKFPGTDNCEENYTTDDDLGKGSININISMADRDLKLYEVGSKRNEINKEGDKYQVTLTKDASESSVSTSVQARFKGDDNITKEEGKLEFKADKSEEQGIKVTTIGDVVGNFECTTTDTFTITYSIPMTSVYNAASVTLIIKFSRTVSPGEALQNYLDKNGGVTLAGSGLSETDLETDWSSINMLEVYPTVTPEVSEGGENIWTVTSSDEKIAKVEITSGATPTPTVKIKAYSQGPVTITIMVKDSKVTTDPGVTTTFNVNVLPDYAYRQYTVVKESSKETLTSVVKNYDTAKIDVAPEANIGVTKKNTDAEDYITYSTEQVSLNAIGVPDAEDATTGHLFTMSVKTVNLSNLENVYISPYVFASGTNLESFTTAPNTVNNLGKYAFFGCTELLNVDFINSTALTTIPEAAFYKCSKLTGVTLSEKVQTIGKSAFFNCISLKTVDLSAMKNGTVTIGETGSFTPGSPQEETTGCFSECYNVETIKLPKAKTDIGRYAFYKNESVTSITGMHAQNIYYGAFNHCEKLKELDISESTDLENISYTGNSTPLTSSEYGSFAYCYSLEIMTMPTANNNSLTMNGYSFAFDYDLKYMVIHHTGQIITNTSEFYGCKQLRSFVVCQESAPQPADNQFSSDMFTNTTQGSYGTNTYVPLMVSGHDGDNTLSSAASSVDSGSRVESKYFFKKFAFLSGNDKGEVAELASDTYYYLTRDITPTATDGFSYNGKNIFVDLNGHRLGYDGDGKNAHIFKGDEDSAEDKVLWIDDSSSLAEDKVGKMSGAKKDLSNDKGGAIWLAAGNNGFKMYFINGSIEGNEALRGGAMYFCDVNSNRPILYMFGGWIKNNVAGNNGGGLYFESDTDIYQYGGDIIGNTCIGNDEDYARGGGVYLAYDYGTRGYYHLYKGARCIWNHLQKPPSTECAKWEIGGFYSEDTQNPRFEAEGAEEFVDYYNEVHEWTKEKSDFIYTLGADNKSLILTGYKGSSSDAVVPEYDYHKTGTTEQGVIIWEYLPVVQAGNGTDAITNNTSGVSLSFAENSRVTTIGANAFSNTNFSSVTLPGSVTTLGNSAFSGNTNLSEVDLSKTSITTLPQSTFQGCTNTNFNSHNIDLPNSLTTIGDNAFNGCTNLDKLDFLPASATSIGKSSFYNNTALESIDTSKWANLNIGNKAFQNCTGIESVNLINGTSTGQYTFSGCTNLTSVAMNSAGDIGPQCFAACADPATTACTNITNVDINCNTIGKEAFLGCTSIGANGAKVNVVANNIEAGAFAASSIPSETEIANQVATNDTNPVTLDFIGPKLDVDITYNIQANIIDKYALYKRTGITTLNVTFGGVGDCAAKCDIKDNALAYTNYSENPKTVLGNCDVSIAKTKGGNIGQHVFDHNTCMKTADFSSTDITVIPNFMFANCTYLDTVWCNNSLTQICEGAFQNCISYSKMNMSWAKSLKIIEGGAFSGCTGITDINLEENYNLESLGNEVFKNIKTLKYLDLPSGTKAKNFKTIGDGAFSGCEALLGDFDTNRLDIPCSITTLGSECFSGCSSLREVNFEGNGSKTGSLKTVGDKTFGECTSIGEIDFTNTQVTTLHSDPAIGAMYGCSNLRKITLPASYSAPVSPGDYGDSANITEVDMSLCTQVTQFGDNAFKDKKKLTTIGMPEKEKNLITTIGNYAFCGCSTLKQFDFSSLAKLTSIGNYAFDYCIALTEIDTSNLNNLSKIGNYAFDHCIAVNEFDTTNLSNLSKIGDYAFYYCTTLQDVDFTKLTALKDIVSESIITPALGAYSFAYCSKITSVNLSSNSQVYVIPESCFQHCTALTSLTLPESIKRVEAYAFYDDTKLDNVDFNSKGTATENLTIEYVGHDAFTNTAHFKNASYIDDGVVFDKSKIVAMGFVTDQTPERFELARTTRVVAAYCLENCSSLRWLIIDETDGHKIYMNDYCITNCSNMTNLVVKQRKSSDSETVDNDNIVWGSNVLANSGSVGKSDGEHAIVPMVVSGGANTKSKFSGYTGISAYTYYPVDGSASASFPELQDKNYYYLDGNKLEIQVEERISSSENADCVLDLNGHKLTRGLESPEPYGQVIAFLGSCLRLDDTSSEGKGSITKGMSTWKDGSVQEASYGGGLYVSKPGATLYFVRGTISNCKALQGGGIYIQNQAKVYIYDEAEINECQATNNMWDGGAIMMACSSEFYMHGGYIHNCRGYNEGGAILANCLNSTKFKMRLYGGKFENNYVGISGTKRNDITAVIGSTGGYDLKGNLVKNKDYVFHEDYEE